MWLRETKKEKLHLYYTLASDMSVRIYKIPLDIVPSNGIGPFRKDYVPAVAYGRGFLLHLHPWYNKKKHSFILYIDISQILRHDEFLNNNKTISEIFLNFFANCPWLTKVKLFIKVNKKNKRLTIRRVYGCGFGCGCGCRCRCCR